MSTEPFIGEVKLLAFNFPPLGYQTCQGQMISIAEYTALFSLIGTTYGGNGQTTFALPDLQGRVPIGQGQGPGLPDYSMGEAAGSPTITLMAANLPAHIHTLNSVRVSIASNETSGSSNTSANAFPGNNDSTGVYAEAPTPNTYMAPGVATISGSTDQAGTNTPFNCMNPYIVMNYSIALEGIFPSRN